ncbi:hypothetical protein [Clostridium sp.]|uniref:hypothetical protein n=1 Tax=Clostridium sp. TaxID=1506 RepID=UPI0032180205
MVYDICSKGVYRIKEGKILGFEPLDMDSNYFLKLVYRETIIEKFKNVELNPVKIKTYNLQYRYNNMGYIEVVCGVDREEAMEAFNKFKKFRDVNKRRVLNLKEFMEFAEANDFCSSGGIEKILMKESVK